MNPTSPRSRMQKTIAGPGRAQLLESSDSSSESDSSSDSSDSSDSEEDGKGHRRAQLPGAARRREEPAFMRMATLIGRTENRPTMGEAFELLMRWWDRHPGVSKKAAAKLWEALGVLLCPRDVQWPVLQTLIGDIKRISQLEIFKKLQIKDDCSHLLSSLDSKLLPYAGVGNTGTRMTMHELIQYGVNCYSHAQGKLPAAQYETWAAIGELLGDIDPDSRDDGKTSDIITGYYVDELVAREQEEV
eukprot:g14912.t1